MGAERGELVIEDLALPLALRFISGKYQGGEFPLPDSGEIVIGRSSELDMVLVEDMVSRRHATISYADGQVSIEDLGSTNGTFVNGEKIKRVRLISTNVLPEYQRWGLGLVLMGAQVPNCLEWGMEEAEFSWVLESNTFSRGSLEKGGAKRTKTYRIYDWEADDSGK